MVFWVLVLGRDNKTNWRADAELISRYQLSCLCLLPLISNLSVVFFSYKYTHLYLRYKSLRKTNFSI